MTKNYMRYAAIATAFTAAASAPANAQIGPLRIQTGGFDIQLTAGAAAQGALFDNNDPNNNNVDGNIDIFGRINAEWTSPGGVIIGANIEQNNQQRETEVLNTGEVYGFVASDFGRVEVGLQDGPADTLAFAAPVIALGQIRGDFSRYAGSQALLRALDTRDAFKVIYLSPPISGLRGGVSWSPQARQNSDAVNPRSRIILDNAFEFGVQYQRPVGDWILGLSGTYATGRADAITTRRDLNSWSVGFEARRGPLRIGGAFVDRGDSNRLNADFNQWEINGGVGWVKDRWGVSSSASYTRSNNGTNRLIGVGAFYAVTPNIQLRSDFVQFREQDVGDPARQGIVGLLELQLSI